MASLEKYHKHRNCLKILDKLDKHPQGLNSKNKICSNAQDTLITGLEQKA